MNGVGAEELDCLALEERNGTVAIRDGDRARAVDDGNQLVAVANASLCGGRPPNWALTTRMWKESVPLASKCCADTSGPELVQTQRTS